MTSSIRTTLVGATIAGIALLSATGGAVAGSLVTSADIKDGTIQGVDVKSAALYSFQSIRGYELVQETATIPADSGGSVQAVCPTGKYVLGVTGYFNGGNEGVQTLLFSDGSGGRVYGDNVGAADTLFVRLICATSPGPDEELPRVTGKQPS